MNRGKRTGEVTRYRIEDGREFDVNEPFYLASCDRCGWVGSSEECGTDFAGGDDTDVYCPTCGLSGADCGKVAEGSVEVTSPLQQEQANADR